MSIEKTTFLTLFDDTMNAGTVTRQTPGTLPGMSKDSSTIEAVFRASFADQMGILMVERLVRNTSYWAIPWLPDRVIETIGGLTVTGAVRRIVKEADAWRDQVKSLVREHAPRGVLSDADQEAILNAGQTQPELPLKHDDTPVAELEGNTTVAKALDVTAALKRMEAEDKPKRGRKPKPVASIDSQNVAAGSTSPAMTRVSSYDLSTGEMTEFKDVPVSDVKAPARRSRRAKLKDQTKPAPGVVAGYHMGLPVYEVQSGELSGLKTVALKGGNSVTIPDTPARKRKPAK